MISTVIRRRLIPLVLARGLSIGLAACGSSSTSSTPSNTSSSSASSLAAHNAADVAFAKDMVPHHRQAIAMAALASGRASSPAVKSLAQQIQHAQGPEITTMTGWLSSWGQQAGTSGTGSMSGMGDSSMPGMMTGSDMDRLAALKGAAFDREFLTMMTAHHRGAIEMAKTEQAAGQYGPTKQLAAGIEKAQTREVAVMAGLYASVGGGGRL